MDLKMIGDRIRFIRINKCKLSQDEFADFRTIQKYIESHLGTDITSYIRDLTEHRYGIQL